MGARIWGLGKSDRCATLLLLDGQFDLFGVLGLVRMLAAGIDLQLIEHVGGQLVLGEHATHGFAKNALGVLIDTTIC